LNVLRVAEIEALRTHGLESERTRRKESASSTIEIEKLQDSLHAQITQTEGLELQVQELKWSHKAMEETIERGILQAVVEDLLLEGPDTQTFRTAWEAGAKNVALSEGDEFETSSVSELITTLLTEWREHASSHSQASRGAIKQDEQQYLQRITILVLDAHARAQQADAERRSLETKYVMIEARAAILESQYRSALVLLQRERRKSTSIRQTLTEFSALHSKEQNNVFMLMKQRQRKLSEGLSEANKDCIHLKTELRKSFVIAHGLEVQVHDLQHNSIEFCAAHRATTADVSFEKTIKCMEEALRNWFKCELPRLVSGLPVSEHTLAMDSIADQQFLTENHLKHNTAALVNVEGLEQCFALSQTLSVSRTDAAAKAARILELQEQLQSSVSRVRDLEAEALCIRLHQKPSVLQSWLQRHGDELDRQLRHMADVEEGERCKAVENEDMAAREAVVAAKWDVERLSKQVEWLKHSLNEAQQQISTTRTQHSSIVARARLEVEKLYDQKIRVIREEAELQKATLALQVEALQADIDIPDTEERTQFLKLQQQLHVTKMQLTAEQKRSHDYQLELEQIITVQREQLERFMCGWSNTQCTSLSREISGATTSVPTNSTSDDTIQRLQDHIRTLEGEVMQLRSSMPPCIKSKCTQTEAEMPVLQVHFDQETQTAATREECTSCRQLRVQLATLTRSKYSSIEPFGNMGTAEVPTMVPADEDVQARVAHPSVHAWSVPSSAQQLHIEIQRFRVLLSRTDEQLEAALYRAKAGEEMGLNNAAEVKFFFERYSFAQAQIVQGLQQQLGAFSKQVTHTQTHGAVIEDKAHLETEYILKCAEVDVHAHVAQPKCVSQNKALDEGIRVQLLEVRSLALEKELESLHQELCRARRTNEHQRKHLTPKVAKRDSNRGELPRILQQVEQMQSELRKHEAAALEAQGIAKQLREAKEDSARKSKLLRALKEGASEEQLSAKQWKDEATSAEEKVKVLRAAGNAKDYVIRRQRDRLRALEAQLEVYLHDDIDKNKVTLVEKWILPVC
jgi:hypothetical protein